MVSITGVRRAPQRVPTWPFRSIGPTTEMGGWMAGGAVALVTPIVANRRLGFGVATGLWDAHAFFCPYYILVADFLTVTDFGGRGHRYPPSDAEINDFRLTCAFTP